MATNFSTLNIEELRERAARYDVDAAHNLFEKILSSPANRKIAANRSNTWLAARLAEQNNRQAQQEALQILQTLDNLVNAEQMYAQGLLYWSGYVVEHDLTKAENHLREAEQLGSIRATARLAILMRLKGNYYL